MSISVRLRRPLVILGVVLSLFAGVATIRAAAVWTAASSPLVAKPPSVESLQATLAAEGARTATLQAQLDELAADATDLTAALGAARDRIVADSGQARDLQAALNAARAKVAALERSIRQAPATAGRGVAATVAAPVAAMAQARDEEHEGGADD